MDKITRQVQSYLNYCELERNMTPQTMRSKRYILKSFKSNIGKKDARKITDSDYSGWRQELLKNGVSPRTVNTRIAHTVAFFKYLERTDTLKIKISSIEPLKVEDTEIRFFKREEIEKVKSLCKGLRDYLLITLAFEAGLRIHELAKLQVEDFNNCHLRIFGKGRILRDSFILPETYLVLGKWLKLNDITSGYIFPSPVDYEGHLGVDMIRGIMKQAFLRAGFDDFNPHDLRHSFATELTVNNAPLAAVQRLLGHKDPKTTAKYIHLLVDQLQEVHHKHLGSQVETEAG